MKNIVLTLLMVLIACGCVSVPSDTIISTTQSTETTETTLPVATTATTATTITTSTIRFKEKLTLDSFNQSSCPENYMKNRFKNDVSTYRFMNLGTGEEFLTILHQLDYVCCANISVSMDVTAEGSDTIINLYEKNIGQVCKCICGYNVTATISGLENGRDYFIRVYGVEYAGEGSKFIAEASTNPRIRGEGGFCGGIAGIRCRDGLECVLDGCPAGASCADLGGVCVMGKGGECGEDSDCATGGCSGQVCTTKDAAPTVITTCEVRPEYDCFKLTSCGCVDGKCQWKKNANFDSCWASKASSGGIS